LHPRSAEIHLESKKLDAEIVRIGYQHDQSWVLRQLKDNETIASVLCGHSERLAIAWNFVVNPRTTEILITKNLRVCGACRM